MKRIIIAIAFLTTCIAYNYAQVAPTASDYKSYKEKLDKNNKTIEDPKKKDLPKTWIERAKLFQDIADMNVQYVRPDMQTTEIKLLFKEPKEIKKENGNEQYVYDNVVLNIEGGKLKNWKESNLIVPNALDSAYNSYLKAIELDKEGKMDKKIGENLKVLKTMYRKVAVNAYSSQDIKGAFMGFKSEVSINELKQVNVKDTLIIYYTGITAFDIGLKDESLIYLNKAKNLNLNEPNIYVYLKNIYISKGDSANALTTLKEGFTKYPENPAILVELINYYLMSKESNAALEYLEKAKAKDPTNKSYLFAEGTLYDKINNSDKAIESYQKAIEIDPLYFDAYYNLAVVYYNMGLKKTEEANNEVDNSKYNAKKILADEDFKKTIPFMAKAHEINPKDRQTLETLKSLYYRLKMKDDLDRVTNELKNLQ